MVHFPLFQQSTRRPSKVETSSDVAVRQMSEQQPPLPSIVSPSRSSHLVDRSFPTYSDPHSDWYNLGESLILKNQHVEEAIKYLRAAAVGSHHAQAQVSHPSLILKNF